MALHSTYGNSAVARAAGATGIASAPERGQSAATVTAPSHTPPHLALSDQTPPTAKLAVSVPATGASAPVQAPGGGAHSSKGVSAPSGTPHRATVAKAAGAAGQAHREPKADAGSSAAATEAAPQSSGAASPQADPAFAAVVHHVQIAAKHQVAHAPASSKASAAHAAVVSPTNEVPSRAAAKHTDAIDQQKPKPFNKEAFKKALVDKIKATAPKTLEAAADFKENNNLGAIKSDLTSEVSQEKAESQGALPETVAAQPDQSGISQTPSTPLPPTDIGGVSHIAAAGAAPKPAGEEQVSLQAGPQELNRQMADANITEAQLKDSNEPAFQSALAQKKGVEAESAAAPKAFRAEEKGMLHHAQAEAQGIATKHAGDMHGARKHAFGAVATHQSEAKEEEEKQRDKIYTAIEKIYESTKKNVEARLQKLDKDVNDTFDSGATDAQKQFEDHVDARMSAYKDDRYSGISGKALWAKDKFFDLPDAVNVFYQEGHDLYVDKMDAVIDRVAALVESGLNEAKALVTAGKGEIQAFLGMLSPAWQATGKKAAAGIQAKFASLEQGITDKQDQLVDSLAKKYNDNLQKVNQRIEQMKEANRGLVSKAVDAVKGAIRVIIELKNMLLNVLARAADAIGSVIAHPINFLGHLVDAGKLGFSNFSAHIVEHLKAGFMEWLFGAVASAGIQLPKSFDLRGILSLVLQILGLTYPNIRSRAVKILGEKVVKALETAAEIFKILITQGPAGLWEYIKEKIGDLKTLVIEKIKSFVMEKIVIAGITWLIGLLNPASAFIKACKAIYDIVMFFVERGKQILDLVNAVIDSITAIAKGAIGAAANFVESSLARTIPVMIGFLASLLGVGGISEKIKEIIEDIRKPINEAIDWVITKAVDLVKAVGGLLGFGKSDNKGKNESSAEADLELDQPLAMHGEGHHVYAVARADKIDVEMATGQRDKLETLVASAIYREEHGPKRGPLLQELKWVEKTLEGLKWTWAAAQNKSDAEKRESIKRDIGVIANHLSQVGTAYGIPNLVTPVHASQYVVGEELMGEYRDSIRSSFYPTKYDAAVGQWQKTRVIELETDPGGNIRNPDQVNPPGRRKYFWCEEKRGFVDKGEATVDHQLWVVKHWNDEGRNTNQAQRDDFYNDISRLRIISRGENSRDGNIAKRDTGGYIKVVGPNFRGRKD